MAAHQYFRNLLYFSYALGMSGPQINYFATFELRLPRARSDSDATYSDELLLFGESAMKTAVSILVAAVDDNPLRSRYHIEHTSVRADGIGATAECLTAKA